MHESGSVRDRLHREMLASGREWGAEEIARSALKIVSDGKRSLQLVAAILGDDERFERAGDAWRALEGRVDRLIDLDVLLVDAPQPRRQGEPVPLAFLPYQRDGRRRSDVSIVQPDGMGLVQLAPLAGSCTVATCSASIVRRRLHELERSHGLPSLSEGLIDLAGIVSLHGESIPSTFSSQEGATAEERLEMCRIVLDSVLDRYGDWSLDRLEKKIEEQQGGDPIDFSLYRFCPDDLAEIPTGPGIYRFLGEDGSVLYVGKSRDLHRRIRSYFRPLAREHRRRARLLAELRDVVWEETPSELEALVLESEEIERFRPTHNQQKETHPSGESLEIKDTDQVFVTASAVAEEASVFFIRDGVAWARTRCPRSREALDLPAAKDLIGQWIDKNLESSSLVPIGESAGRIVVRYLKAFGIHLDRIRMTDVPSAEDAAEALIELVVRHRPGDDSWIVRSAGVD